MGLPIVCTAAFTGLGMTWDSGREKNTHSSNQLQSLPAWEAPPRPEIISQALSTDDDFILLYMDVQYRVRNCFPVCLQKPHVPGASFPALPLNTSATTFRL